MIIFPGGIIERPAPNVVWTDSTSSASATSPHSFTSRAIGTADASREVFVAVYNGAASAVTVGGVSATLVETAASNTLTLWRAAVPSGTTATVVVTYTGGGGRLLISVFAAYNLQSTTPHDTASYFASSTPATTHATTIDTASQGILIAVASTLVTSGNPGPSWSGATFRDHEVLDIGAIDFILSAADSTGTVAASNATVQTTWSPAVGSVAMVAATFR